MNVIEANRDNVSPGSLLKSAWADVVPIEVFLFLGCVGLTVDFVRVFWWACSVKKLVVV